MEDEIKKFHKFKQWWVHNENSIDITDLSMMEKWEMCTIHIYTYKAANQSIMEEGESA